MAADPSELEDSCLAGNRCAESGKAVNAPCEDERRRAAAVGTARAAREGRGRGAAAPTTTLLLLVRAGQQVPRRAIDIEKVFIAAQLLSFLLFRRKKKKRRWFFVFSSSRAENYELVLSFSLLVFFRFLFPLNSLFSFFPTTPPRARNLFADCASREGQVILNQSGTVLRKRTGAGRAAWTWSAASEGGASS